MTTNPLNPKEWYWVQGVLTCKLLSPWQHGFFTRSHAPQLPQDLSKCFSSESKAFHAKQVHGDRIVNTLEFTGDRLPEADGVFTSQPSTSVWACSADCVPILIGDPVLQTVAAIHGGWRGTAQGILIKAIAKFIEHGSDLANLLIALGPAISGESYQVQNEVADQVLTTIKKPVGVSPDAKLGHCRLDIRLVQQQQLLELGLTTSQIAIAPFCTFQTPQHFFSYRRTTLVKEKSNGLEHPKPQIQWSGIKSN